MLCNQSLPNIDYDKKNVQVLNAIVHVMGVACTNQSYFLCYIFSQHESEDDYIWALEKMRIVFQDRITGPIVIVTDRELALMAGISRVLPEAKNLLCIWHINKNVLANAIKHFANDEDWNQFFNGLYCSSTEQEFEKNWVLLEDAINETGYAYFIPHGFRTRRNSSLLGPKQ